MDARRREFYIFRETRIPKDCPDFDTLAVLYHDTRNERYLAWMLNRYETRMNALALAAATHYDMDGYFSDLKNCVVHAICRANEHFDSKRDVKFSTFLNWSIKDEIYSFVRTLRRGFSGMSKSTDELFRKAMAMSHRMENPTAQDLPEKIAKEVGCSVKVITELLQCGWRQAQLVPYEMERDNGDPGEEERSRPKTYLRDPGGSAETVFIKEQRATALWDTYQSLTMQEQEMVAAYIGFCPECGSSFRLEQGKLVPQQPMFFADIAAIHQMYEPRTAKKIIDKALSKMRERLMESGWYTAERNGLKTK